MNVAICHGLFRIFMTLVLIQIKTSITFLTIQIIFVYLTIINILFEALFFAIINLVTVIILKIINDLVISEQFIKNCQIIRIIIILISIVAFCTFLLRIFYTILNFVIILNSYTISIL